MNFNIVYHLNCLLYSIRLYSDVETLIPERYNSINKNKILLKAVFNNPEKFKDIKNNNHDICIAFIDTILSYYRKERIDFHSIISSNNIENNEDLSMYIYDRICKKVRNPSVDTYRYMRKIPELAIMYDKIDQKIQIFKDMEKMN